MITAPETPPTAPRRALLVPLAVLLFPLVLVGAMVLGVTESRDPLP